jgi:hypothetical protein
VDLFTAGAIAIGALAFIVTGLSKTALPGAGLLAVPLFAVVAEGRGNAYQPRSSAEVRFMSPILLKASTWAQVVSATAP